MLVFALKRVLWIVPVLLVCVTLLFGLVHAIGGGPLQHGPPLGLSHEAWVKYGDPKPESITRNMRHRLGIDAPWYEQYWRYVRSVARLDFGPTTTFPGRSVNEILREQGPVTAELVGLALVWVVVLGVGLGVGAAVWRGTVFDRAATATTALLMGVPIFLTATLAIWLVSVKLGLLPTSGWNGWRSRVLPSLVLALLPLAQVARVLRFEMIEVGARVRRHRQGEGPPARARARRARPPAGVDPGAVDGGAAPGAARARPLPRRMDLRDPRHRAVLHRGRADARLPAHARADGRADDLGARRQHALGHRARGDRPARPRGYFGPVSLTSPRGVRTNTWRL
ncbi:MAG TPA: ABC transporter permease [Gaiellaceae bacterium]|nr:ABC transporter permease [Gaiellaceae bacterium]